MPAHNPEEVHTLFSAYFSAGDLDSLVSLYEPGAVIMPEPGQTVAGKDAIRQVLSSFLALKGAFAMQPAHVVRCDDIALLCSRWTLEGTGVQLSGQTADVVRRQPDGSWLMVIDSPFGGAALK